MIEFLRWMRDSALPNCYPGLYHGLLLEGSGPPDDTTPTDCLAYGDTDSGKCYVSKTKEAGVWEEISDASALTPSGETLLTATV